ncbi:MAG TPA: hypothetical protein VMZ28_29000 [Kofleriaceae bacterium]|nr:hypothetical protein [Kofleriaceae bacterium]
MSDASCKRCGTPVEEADLRCCICAYAVEAGAATVATTAARATILRCRECAAAVAYVAEAQAPQCAFCGSVMDTETPADPLERAEWIVPFAVDRAAAGEAMRRWMSSLGWFRPRDLSSSATIESIRPLHWAAWIFDADALVTWTADSDAGSQRSKWAPHAGKTSFTWRNILVSASRGLTAKETGRLTAGFRLDGAVAIDDDKAPEEGAVEAFDVQRSAARRKIVDAVEATAERQLLDGGHVPGSSFRNVNASVLLERLHTRRYVLPSWVLAYRYKGSLYRSVVHGQDDSIAFGEAPVSWAKIALLVGIAAALVLVLLALFAR